jgi:signal-transduction protein with cAMP-binding, CBS, and nucleotidyltransferase domain
MDNQLASFMARNMSLTDEEAEFIASCMPVRTYEKGTILLREGQVATECYMNLKGLVRRYYLVDGEDRTTAFYAEDKPIASLVSYNNNIPADHYFACLEDTTLTILTKANEQKMSERFSHFAEYCRLNTEISYGKHQEMHARFITSSPEERYLHMLQTTPELLNRVPQYHLASYLGIKPESLSRIRKRVMHKVL